MAKKEVRKKKKLSKDAKTLIIIGCVVLVVAITFTVLQILTSPKPSELDNTFWKSVSAYDAKGKEVDLREIYNNNYSEYQGSMSFEEGGVFSYWMTAGNPEDGTHSGKYTFNEDDTLTATFDNGDEKTFTIIRNNDETIKRIETPYGDYTIWFEPNV